MIIFLNSDNVRYKPDRHTKTRIIILACSLAVDELPYNPLHSVVCMGEKPYQFWGDAREPLSIYPSDNEKIDFECKRNDIYSVFSFLELQRSV